jgi:hypothetical protein
MNFVRLVRDLVRDLHRMMCDVLLNDHHRMNVHQMNDLRQMMTMTRLCQSDLRQKTMIDCPRILDVVGRMKVDHLKNFELVVLIFLREPVFHCMKGEHFRIFVRYLRDVRCKNFFLRRILYHDFLNRVVNNLVMIQQDVIFGMDFRLIVLKNVPFDVLLRTQKNDHDPKIQNEVN